MIPKFIDWEQVAFHGGIPCFHVEDGKFCLRVETWDGHKFRMHQYISFAAYIEQKKNKAVIAALEALPCLLENDIGVSDCIAASIEKYYCHRCQALAEARKGEQA